MAHPFALVGMVVASGIALALALLGLLGSSVANPPTIYAAEFHVCPSGCAYSSVQAAIDAASAGDVIKVVAGAYTDVHVRPRNDITITGVVTQIVYLSKTITIRGGYTTTNWLAADPIANPTTLDAQGQGRVLYITGDISPTIEGFRIRGGKVMSFGSVGGGVYLYTSAAILKNNIIFSNTAASGGGLYLYSSHATLSGNTVMFNSVYYDGGGLYLDSSAATLSNNEIVSNIADGDGGGRFFGYSPAALSGNTVTSNTAYYDGGGLYLYFSPATLRSNIIVSNTTESGGGLFLFHSAATLSGNIVAANIASGGSGGGLAISLSPATLSRNVISANHAHYGGGLSLYGPGTFTRNIVTSNTADYGGGLDLVTSDATFINNMMTDNHADIEGSGLRIGYNSSPRLYHTTVAHNSGGEGSGVLITGSSHADLVNTILVSHTVGITVAGGGSAVLSSTLWGSEDWANATNWSGDGTIITGTVNVFGDPGFVNPDAGDYHIGFRSAARDAGVDAGVMTDIDNQPRPYQAPDIGADEYWPLGAPKYFYLPLLRRN
jgi:parallel beta-helix repeat protein